MGVHDEIRHWWDEDAATYDDSPNHRPPTAAERAAWTGALERLLPEAPARILDCGAGTGFLSLTAARLGHHVTAVDVSPAMLSRLSARAADEGLAIETIEGRADEVATGGYDAVMERHLLWTLPDPVKALTAWRNAARVGGRFVSFGHRWQPADRLEVLRARGRQWFHRLQGRPSDHHGAYPESIRTELSSPGAGNEPSTTVELLDEAGWQAPRLVHLADVDWAISLRLGPVERLLGVTPRFAVVATKRD